MWGGCWFTQQPLLEEAIPLSSSYTTNHLLTTVFIPLVTERCLIMNNPNVDPDRRRRDTWAALLGVAFFLLFMGAAFANFQPSLFNSASVSSLQGSLFASKASQRSDDAQAAGVAGSVSSSNLSANATMTAVTQATASAQATAAAKEAPLTVLLTSGSSVTHTTKSYTGPITITVSGTGQAAGKKYSDAFYVYTDEQGNPVEPTRVPAFALLCINGQPTDQFVQTIPAYNASHRYTFSFQALGGPLSFGSCDPDTTDNTGSFTITFN